MKSKIKGLAVTSSAIIMMLFVSAKTTFATGINKAFTEAGVKSTGDVSGLYTSLKSVVNIVITIGAFWAIAWLIVAGMTLSASGGNPQKRNAGILSLGMVLIGIFVIYKSYDIAGWATGLGSQAK